MCNFRILIKVETEMHYFVTFTVCNMLTGCTHLYIFVFYIRELQLFATFVLTFIFCISYPECLIQIP